MVACRTSWNQVRILHSWVREILGERGRGVRGWSRTEHGGVVYGFERVIPLQDDAARIYVRKNRRR